MNVGIYCIKDTLLGFQNPFCAMNDASAIRMFELSITKEDTVFSLHKEHFSLYKLGTFNAESGEIVSKVEFIKDGAFYVRNIEKENL